MRLSVVGVLLELGMGVGSLSLSLLSLVVGTCGMACMRVLRRRRGIREMGGVGLGIFFDLMFSIGCVCVCVYVVVVGGYVVCCMLWLDGEDGIAV